MTYSLEARPPARDGPRSRAIEALGPWFHNLHLPSGEQTAPNHPLGDFPRFKWEQIRGCIPADLTGKTALDIGCNAGFYSIELARRGARVVGLEPAPRYLAQSRWAVREFGLENRIELLPLTVYDLCRPDTSLPEIFDIVVFMGVLYHLRYPLLGLDLAASRVGGLLVFQTLTTPDDEIAHVPDDLPISERARLAAPGWPRLAFVEGKLASDPTNWWVPNAACCEAMLRSAGLRIVRRPGHEIYICEPMSSASRHAWVRELGSALPSPPPSV